MFQCVVTCWCLSRRESAYCSVTIVVMLLEVRDLLQQNMAGAKVVGHKFGVQGCALLVEDFAVVSSITSILCEPENSMPVKVFGWLFTVMLLVCDLC